MTVADFTVDNVENLVLTTRFAPSPTGLLHRGHAFSAHLAWQLARRSGGRFVLRIEDIDTARCRPAFEVSILADLAWLVLDWDGPVWRQSARSAVYRAVLDRLVAMGAAYPCFCTRADIAAAASAPHGPDGLRYPGTCRQLSPAERARRLDSKAAAWRLDVAAALAITGPLHWHDSTAGWQAAEPAAAGDIVIARRDVGTAYALAVVVDDAAQGVTDVVRGADLFEATHGQILLQALLGLPTPRYHHHALIMGSDGRRLSKRDTGETLAALRAAGLTPADILLNKTPSS
ncbi:tRNA glutamyl-Q(34) synthetase GluQRS [Sandarakinorhabdus sp.]|uniref:tRNA glutamyl-Q(34) synthetase GluQRS n=1 Tax=Sandarakinorhabdus sp. TaxID=1916663 RepID=UPI00333F3E8B